MQRLLHLQTDPVPVPVERMGKDRHPSQGAGILETKRQGIARPNANSGVQYVLDWIAAHSMLGPYIVVADDDEAGKKGAWDMKNVLSSGTVIIPTPYNDLYQRYLETGLKEVDKWLRQFEE